MINYYLLTKPGIILGNLFTVAAGFLLASQGKIDLLLFLTTMLGLALIMASGCVFNNYIDRHIDGKMVRTRNRPLVRGLISGPNAIIFAVIMLVLGNVVLGMFVNILSLVVANFGFFVYVVLYSLWKCRTIYGTAIGSVAGAVPPIVGYCAAADRLDTGALVLFLILVFWQMPHFFSIAMYRMSDYVRASVPVLPIVKGSYVTKWRMVGYIIAFMLASAALTWLGYTGYLFLFAGLILGTLWLILCLKGFRSHNDPLWAGQMFRFSLVVIIGLCLVMPFDIRI